jgi:hypothetical protein
LVCGPAPRVPPRPAPDELILVADPITEASIRRLGPVATSLRRSI